MANESAVERLTIQCEADLVAVRHRVRLLTKAISMGLVDETKFLTAVSEISRNALIYGGGGTAHLQCLEVANRSGVRVTVEDQGPGIPDLDRAMQNGFSTARGLGLGLPGSKRLVHEFDLWSQVGVGTKITILQWKTN